MSAYRYKYRQIHTREQRQTANTQTVNTMASIKQILGAVTAYANKNGMTASDVLGKVRSHEDFPKGKRGRPRKDAVSSPMVERKRPRGRPPAGAQWDEDQECYVNMDDGEVYQKVEKVSSGRPRGRPRTNQPKVPSTRPKGRPPKGKVWSEEQGMYVDEE